jgi:virginiamycin B lyase
MRRTFLTCLTAAVSAGFATSTAAQGQAAQLPEGPEKALTEAVCTTCHTADLITTASGYTRDEWQIVMRTMVDLPDSAEARIAEYLAVNFPPNTLRAPTLVAGDEVVRFREWRVPTLGQRSRDPIEAMDGSIWWTGQYGNLVGRIDPRTGEMKEYTLPPNARPHTVVEDRDGFIWYTGNANGTIGRLDPKTGDIRQFAMPDPAARDPHSAVFDPKGILWFTLQQSNMAGRLDPATGDIRLFPLPTKGSRPYGIQVDSKGTPWIGFNGANVLAAIDPQTLEVRQFTLPNAAARPRRLALDSQDRVWYADTRGYLARFDPATGEVKEWPSPSGPRSSPYAIAVINDIVWYNESGMRPDTLVRFDPATEKFQSWPIPSWGIYAGIIRHLDVTREGNLVIHQSSTNSISLVEIGRQAGRPPSP